MQSNCILGLWWELKFDWRRFLSNLVHEQSSFMGLPTSVVPRVSPLPWKREDNTHTSNKILYFYILQFSSREISVNHAHCTQEKAHSAVGRQAELQTLDFLLQCPSQCLILSLFSFLSVLSLCS